MARSPVATRSVSMCSLAAVVAPCDSCLTPPNLSSAQVAGRQAVVARPVRPRVLARAAATATITRGKVPLKLEEGEMPLNTYNNKAPFKAQVVSVERIVGPKATGETCNIVIKTDGKIPFWEGQSYGVIPPVSLSGREVMCTDSRLYFAFVIKLASP